MWHRVAIILLSFTAFIALGAAYSQSPSPWIRIEDNDSTYYFRRDAIIAIESNSNQLAEYRGLCTVTLNNGKEYFISSRSASNLIEHINKY